MGRKDGLRHSTTDLDNTARKAGMTNTSLTGYRSRTKQGARKGHTERNTRTEVVRRMVVYKVDRQVDMAYCI